MLPRSGPRYRDRAFVVRTYDFAEADRVVVDAVQIQQVLINLIRNAERAVLLVTHYQRLLDYIVPDVVHVMSQGQIVKSGDKDLAKALEASGYAEYRTSEAA